MRIQWLNKNWFNICTIVIGVSSILANLYLSNHSINEQREMADLKIAEIRKMDDEIEVNAKEIRQIESNLIKISKANIKNTYILALGSLSRANESQNVRQNKVINEYAKAIIPNKDERKKFFKEFIREYKIQPNELVE